MESDWYVALQEDILLHGSKTLATIWQILPLSSRHATRLVCQYRHANPIDARRDSGIPIHLIPSGDWDKSDVELTVEVTHSNLGTQLFDFTIQSSNISFMSSPVLWGRSNTNLMLKSTTLGQMKFKEPSPLFLTARTRFRFCKEQITSTLPVVRSEFNSFSSEGMHLRCL